jgi:hypothetical protein
MDASKIDLSKTYIYYPPKKIISDNAHFPAEIIEKRPRNMFRIKLFSSEFPNGKLRTVSAKRLIAQDDFFDK